jgi:mono/diheme cytochrome c family protein
VQPEFPDRRLMMKMSARQSLSKYSICLLAFFVPALWLAIWYSAARGQTERQNEPTISTEQLNHAKTVFAEKCARCHGEDGRGETALGGMLRAPNFTTAAFWTNEMKSKRLTGSITNGRKEMPAFGKKLTRQEINSLVVFVRRFYKPGEEKQTAEGEEKHP